jgi:hypothetical protein
MPANEAVANIAEIRTETENLFMTIMLNGRTAAKLHVGVPVLGSLDDSKRGRL